MLKRLFGRKETNGTDQGKIAELAGLYIMLFRGEGDTDWVLSRMDRLQRELGPDKAEAAKQLALVHESMYDSLMY